MATIWPGHLCQVGAQPDSSPQRTMDDLAEVDAAIALGVTDWLQSVILIS
jgi:hypothetical protein